MHAQGERSGFCAAARIAEIDEVDDVLLTAGRFDVLAEVVCADDSAFFELLNERIRSIPGVKTTETFMYLKLVKQSYRWGTR